MYIADEKPAVDQRAPAPAPETTSGGPDGAEVAGRHAGHFDYLSKLARDLGVPDPVEEYFAPVVGRWSDMEAEAGRWRQVGNGTAVITDALGKPLGKLDAAWDGAAATSFIDYMQKIGLAGHDLSDAMLALAEVLDTTAEGIREIVEQMGGVLAETAETASQAMVMPVQGDDRTRTYLDAMRRPTKELFEAVRQVLEAFVQMCQGIDGSEAFQQIKMAHTFPEDNWSFESPKAPGAVDGKPPADPKTDTAGADLAGAGGGGLGGLGGGGGSSLSGVGGAMPPGGSAVATEQAPVPKPESTAAVAATDAKPAGGRGYGGMMPMAPMMGMMGQGSGGDHKPRTRLMGDPQDIFGKPEKASSPVIGDDD
ncbi:MAG TPA: hypothetical protein VH969_07395 [Actinophytocola sp.]|uniref:WXG100 family type VII secretion target n=1 Tax=Actinophytocola sp. TaxID=1872138 RepID=UPI002F95C058